MSCDWPRWSGSDSLLLASIVSVTEYLRPAAAALPAPLRHPPLMARELGNLNLLREGRLLVHPTVSGSREAHEVDVPGIPFVKRDRQDVYFEPKAHRLEGPSLWFGGRRAHAPVLRRLVRYGHGFHPLGRPALPAQGRHGRHRPDVRPGGAAKCCAVSRR
ncbi:hypothetical protein [Streptomyces sp. NPDC047043]|uniref:hypothetical protein n=1 Tax=Streptomyces sp. NPDC047043 TaxID=3154497 RepID=UPI0033D72DD2